MKIAPVFFIVFMLAGSFFTSCKYNPVVIHPCDTCCDTCKTDTTHKPPCDTCNIDKDSAAHAFIWKEYINKIPGETNLTGVWVFGPNDILICANSLYHFDGTNFTLIDENYTRHPTISLNGALNGNNIFAFSPTDFWLIDGIAFHSTDVHHLDDMRPPGNLHACWGTKSSDMFFVGDAGIIFHWDGTNFTQMTSGTTNDLHSVWGISGDDVWAGGLNRSTGATVLLHYSASTWSEVDLSTLGQFGCANCDGVSSVWAIDSNNHKLSYVGGSFFYRNRDNGSWTNDGDQVGNKLTSGGYAGLSYIRGNTATDIMCVSDWGFASHWNGKTWKRFDNIYDPQNPFYLTNAMSFNLNTACIVGEKSGQSWMAVGTRR